MQDKTKEIKKEVILKHDLLQTLSSKFTKIDEQRFLNSCLVDTWQRETISGKDYYPINIANYADKSGLSLGQAYTEIKKMLKLCGEPGEIPLDTGETWVTRIIYSYKYDDINLTLSAKFNEEIISYLSGDMLKGTFCYYDGRMGAIPSNKRYIMGEILQRQLYEFNHKDSFTLPLHYLRQALNLHIDEYKVYADLYKRVIKETLFDLARIRGDYIKAKKSNRGITFTKITKEEFKSLHAKF